MVTSSDRYDVIVIGSGATGAITAWRLAQTGASVLMLEAGETSPERVELVGAYARAPARTPGAPYRGRQGDRLAPDPETDRDYYQYATPVQFASTYLRRVGGSTWHFLGNVPRFVPNDFGMKSRYGVGVDWPIGYTDLEPDYCEAEQLLGVSGDHAQWDGTLGATRSRPYPMTKVWESYGDRQVTPAINALQIDGTSLRVMSTPQARNSTVYDGRPACAGNSTCVPICPIQAKYDGTVHVEKAVDAGAEVQDRSVVTAIELAEGATTVSAVRYTDWSGASHRVSARVVVLAAHAVESAKLLLLSGIANTSDQVGRNLMDHPQGSGACLMPAPVYGFRGPPTTSGIDVFRDGPFRAERAAFRMSLGNDGWGRIESPAATVGMLVGERGLFGAELRDALRDRLTRQFRISYSTELLPESSNRVTLSGQRDALGIPKPLLAFGLPDYNLAAFEYARMVIGSIFTALSGTEVVFSPDGSDLTKFSGAGHVLGTCRMGSDAQTSVIDANCRSHDHKNLFIVGASVFPTGGTANPTLTAVALTMRAIRAVIDDLTRGMFR